MDAVQICGEPTDVGTDSLIESRDIRFDIKQRRAIDHINIFDMNDSPTWNLRLALRIGCDHDFS